MPGGPPARARIASRVAAALDAADAAVTLVGAVPDVVTFFAEDLTDVDVVLLDLQLGDGSDPKDNTEVLRAAGHRVLVYSVADNARLVRRALAGGADGVRRKAEPITETIAAILAVAGGRQAFSAEVLAALEGDAAWVAAALGPREREVLTRYAAGLEIPEIGRRLFITENSVKEYLKRIRAKYTRVDRPAASRLELFRRAVEDGLLPPVEPLG